MPYISIPEARERLRELAINNEMPELAELAAMMYRRSSGRPRAPSTSDQVTAVMADEIRAFADRFPNMTQHEIATIFNVNPGRVSECLTGRH